MPRKIPVELIEQDPRTQSRRRIDDEVVERYAETLAEHDKSEWPFPAVIVYFDGASYWLADGFHRRLAALKAERVTILAEVRDGTWRDALDYAAKANDLHGLPMTREDKRWLIGKYLDDEERRLTQAEIAEKCGVTRRTVAAVVSERSSPPQKAVKAFTDFRGGDKKKPQGSGGEGSGAGAATDDASGSHTEEPKHDAGEQQEGTARTRRTGTRTVPSVSDDALDEIISQWPKMRNEVKAAMLSIAHCHGLMPQHLADSEVFCDAWARFIVHRVELKKPLAIMSIQANLQTCSDMGPEAAARAIDNSIRSGWPGVYPDTKKKRRDASQSDEATAAMEV